MKKLFTDFLVFYYRIRRYLQDHRVVERPRFEKFRCRFYKELWQDTAAKMTAKIEDFGHGYFKISRNSQYTFVLEAKVMLDDHLSLRMAGNKPLVHRILSEHDYPIQDYLEYNVHSLSKAYQFIQKAGRPCVVKPAAATGAGNGITTKIQTFKELRRASLWAATFHDRLLIEEEIPGASYRLLYLNGKFIDAVRRDLPLVIGDGRRTIKELMQRETQRRLSGDEIISLAPLDIDYECKLCLKYRKLSLKYVPETGEKIALKTVCNQNTSAENESVRERVHPSIIKAGSEIANIFRLKLVGVDLITQDITRPLREVGGVINEINTNPGLHHHYLIKNKQDNAGVAQAILEYILSRKPG